MSTPPTQAATLHHLGRVIDPDGNALFRGLAVVSHGRRWVVGYASPTLIRLDRRRSDGRTQSLLLARRHFRLIHPLGWTAPLIF